MSDVKHKEWFIVALVPHIWKPLMQQKIMMQREALEIVMKLEASHVGENVAGVNQIQVQLENLTLQLKDIKKGKENHKDILCTHCHADGHTKDTCPTFRNYLLSGVPNPLSCGSVPWYRICQVYGHQHKECSYMQKIVSNPTNLYCSFCKSVGHEDKYCRAYHLLQERTYDS